MLFNEISSFFMLNTAHRQAEDEAFNQVLERIARRNVTEEDVNFLNQRYELTVEQSVRRAFINNQAPLIHANRVNVRESNLTELARMNEPIVLIRAHHQPVGLRINTRATVIEIFRNLGEQASSERDGGLEQKLELCINT